MEDTQLFNNINPLQHQRTDSHHNISTAKTQETNNNNHIPAVDVDIHNMSNHTPPQRTVADGKVRALIIIDVQNEFMSPDGNFPVPVDCKEMLVKNLKALVPRFRQTGGEVIWIKAFYGNRTEEPAGMKEYEKGSDEWLKSATHVYHIPCCEAGTFGSEIDPEVLSLAEPTDSIIVKGWYSAFHENPQFLELLQSKNITEAYFCGLATGTCVLATILDAVKVDGLRVYGIQDCMGWRRYNSHEEAIERMKQLPTMFLVDSHDV